MLYREVVLFHCCVLFPNMNLLSQFVCYTVDGYLACELFFFLNLGQMSYSLILAITYPNDFFFLKQISSGTFFYFHVNSIWNASLGTRLNVTATVWWLWAWPLCLPLPLGWPQLRRFSRLLEVPASGVGPPAWFLLAVHPWTNDFISVSLLTKRRLEKEY